MITVEPGRPVTHWFVGIRFRMPSSAEIRSFVQASNSKIACKSSGLATLSRIPTEGNRHPGREKRSVRFSTRDAHPGVAELGKDCRSIPSSCVQSGAYHRRVGSCYGFEPTDSRAPHPGKECAKPYKCQGQARSVQVYPL